MRAGGDAYVDSNFVGLGSDCRVLFIDQVSAMVGSVSEVPNVNVSRDLTRGLDGWIWQIEDLASSRSFHVRARTFALRSARLDN